MWLSIFPHNFSDAAVKTHVTTVQQESEACRQPALLTIRPPSAAQTIGVIISVNYLLILAYEASLLQRATFSVTTFLFLSEISSSSWLFSEIFVQGFKTAEGPNIQAAPPGINRTIVFQQYLQVLKVSHALKCSMESTPEKSPTVI